MRSSEVTLERALNSCTLDPDSDMFLYSGSIYPAQVNRFVRRALSSKKRKNLSLILTTHGGDAHAAYRLARTLRSVYAEIRLLVVGPCKSAGTLVALCASELAFGPFGELGPLDVQVNKKDDLITAASGLDTFQALGILQNHAFKAFETYMLSMVESSGGAISTRMACDVACQLVTGLFQPLTAQLDPQRMGEMERMMTIAKAYGERLAQTSSNLRPGALQRLIEEYPSHSFIIDQEEAKGLFKKILPITPEEWQIVLALTEKIGNPNCVFVPTDDILFFDAATLYAPDSEASDDEAARAVASDPGSNGQGEPSKAPASGEDPGGVDQPGTTKSSRRTRSSRAESSEAH